HFLEEAARKHPDNIATVFIGARMTYREIDTEANRLAHALQKLGIAKGDRVALVLPNCPQFVIGYYAILKAGAVAVPTNPTYTARELQYQFADAGVRTVITLNLFVPAIQEIQTETPIQELIVTGVRDYLPTALSYLYPIKEKREGTAVHVARGAGIYDFATLVRQTTPDYTPVPAAASDLALLQYTGGTTGTSKGAMLTHANLIANTCQTRAWLPNVRSGGSEVFLAVTPFFHVYGMTSVMNFAVSVAATMVLLPRFNTKDVLKAIQRHRVTCFGGVPTMYIAINNFPDVARYRLSSIRACISGAAPLPVEVAQEFERLTGGSLREGYGLTEAAPVTHCNPVIGPGRSGSIGLPFPDVQVRIVDSASGEDLPEGTIGELAIRGPQVMAGYWNQPAETTQVLRDGWLLTGDMARVDSDGFFYIVDRKKDIIIAAGFNIYPREVEEVLYEHPAVKEAVVAGVPDPYRGETVKAYVVLKDNATATSDELVAFCRGRLAGFKVPRQLEFRESLPKSLVGKHLRRVLIEEERAKLAAPLGA
ncbi:MAG TPA: long-chain fatty acid--CoA ligase, partial [Chloroflexia bacterium]|nr:long-chain fatty acid--CoA ligase [Chloroflexia bacterium]